jgi:hypothetical protein
MYQGGLSSISVAFPLSYLHIKVMHLSAYFETGSNNKVLD